MTNRIKYESVRVPGELDPVEVPVLLVDIDNDGERYAHASWEMNPEAGGGGSGGSTLGTPHTNGFDVDDQGVTIVAENTTRLSLLIINNSDTDAVYIKGGESATQDHHSIKIVAGGTYTADKTSSSYDAIAETGVTVSVTVEEVASTWPVEGGT